MSPLDATPRNTALAAAMTSMRLASWLLGGRGPAAAPGRGAALIIATTGGTARRPASASGLTSAPRAAARAHRGRA